MEIGNKMKYLEKLSSDDRELLVVVGGAGIGDLHDPGSAATQLCYPLLAAAASFRATGAFAATHVAVTE